MWSSPSYSREGGKLSRKSQILLLFEDKRQEVFAYRFLLKMGWIGRQIRIRSAKPGKGSAEQYVRNRFPKELAEHRRRSVSQVLIVMLDGDKRGIRGRMAELDDACKNVEMEPRARKSKFSYSYPLGASKLGWPIWKVKQSTKQGVITVV